jgi:hypothetical protein
MDLKTKLTRGEITNEQYEENLTSYVKVLIIY